MLYMMPCGLRRWGHLNGATGAIGSAAVQLSKYFNINVTAVCGTDHLDTVKALGADQLIDYQKEDFTKSEQLYDFVLDAVGKSSFFKCHKLLKLGGVYVSTDLGFMAQNIFLPMISPIIRPLVGMKRCLTPFPVNIHRSLLLVKSLIERGDFTPLIDRKYPFDHIVEAYKYVEQGQKIGNVVVPVVEGDKKSSEKGYNPM